MMSSIERIDDVPINDPLTVETQELDIVINNITSLFKCGSEIDFKKVPQKYVSRTLTGWNVMLKIDNCTVLIRVSGKARCMGASSENQALIVADKSIQKLKLWGFDASVKDFKIVNLFCTALFPWKIQIEAMVNKYPNDFMYEPELQNYCSLKVKKGEGFLGVYPSGSIRVIGLSVEMISTLLERALPAFSEFRF